LASTPPVGSHALTPSDRNTDGSLGFDDLLALLGEAWCPGRQRRMASPGPESVGIGMLARLAECAELGRRRHPRERIEIRSPHPLALEACIATLPAP
jgi:hypothetical protein